MTTVGLFARFGRVPIVKALGAINGVTVREVDSLSDLAPLTSEADVLLMTDPSAEMGAVLAGALRDPNSKVRWIQALSAGFDGLLRNDLPSGLIVTGQGGALAVPVAEHAVGLLLGLSRQLFEIGRRFDRQAWDRTFVPAQRGLEGGTVAIVGFGHIGREIAKRLRAFGMTIIAVSRAAPDGALADEHVPLADIRSALAKADAIVVAIGLGDGTRALFDAAAFVACKQGALFVNVARGEIVEQGALIQALADGQLDGAAIDVTSPEPLPAGDPLWQAPNLIISPHVAGAGSAFSGQRIARTVDANMRRFLQGDDLLHRMR